MAAGACFATRNDVRTLQGDIAVLRAENARSDSVHRAQFQLAAAQAAAVSDSLRAVSAFLVRFSTDVSRFQGDLSITLHTFGQQLLTVQELVGQSQKNLQGLKAQLERQEADLANASTPSSAPTSLQGSSPGTQMGPSGLLSAGVAQLNHGAFATARSVFEDFLAQYPTNDLAGEAQWNIARSYEGEQNLPAADSAYALVVSKYPKSDRAATSLYKRAMLAKVSNPAASKALFQQLVDQYPKSPEAITAADQIKKP